MREGDCQLNTHWVWRKGSPARMWYPSPNTTHPQQSLALPCCCAAKSPRRGFQLTSLLRLCSIPQGGKGPETLYQVPSAWLTVLFSPTVWGGIQPGGYLTKKDEGLRLLC